MVFANQWRGAAPGLRNRVLGDETDASRVAQSFLGIPGGVPTEDLEDMKAAPASGWPSTSPCCDGGQSPSQGYPSSADTAASQLPGSIPAYPNAQLLSTGSPAAAGGRSLISETYLSGDAVADVAAFYRTQMIASGWSVLPVDQEPDAAFQQWMGAQGGDVQMEMLSYRQGSSVCGIAISRQSADLSALKSSGVELPASQTAHLGQTVIAINYVDSRQLQGLLDAANPTASPALNR